MILGVSNDEVTGRRKKTFTFDTSSLRLKLGDVCLQRHWAREEIVKRSKGTEKCRE